MKQQVIRELSQKELQDKIQEAKHSLVSLKLTHSVSPLPNPNEIKVARRLVARLLTENTKRKIQK